MINITVHNVSGFRSVETTGIQETKLNGDGNSTFDAYGKGKSPSEFAREPHELRPLYQQMPACSPSPTGVNAHQVLADTAGSSAAHASATVANGSKAPGVSTPAAHA